MAQPKPLSVPRGFNGTRVVLPDLGDASPEIAILHVDPKTEATQLLIRTPKALHVRQHWHSANWQGHICM